MVDSDVRRLPVYMLLDCSGSMMGDPIEAVRQGLRLLVSDLKGDPHARETVWLSVITFDSSARQLVPLTDITQFQEPNIDATGATALGAALKLLVECMDREVRKRATQEQKADWKPTVFLFTDGQPTDNWESAADELKQKKVGTVIAAGTPGADENTLKRITDTVIRIQDASPGSLTAFMKWVTQSITTTSASIAAKGDAPVRLPNLPEDKGIVLLP